MQEKNITKQIFSSRLRTLMDEKGLTQLQVATGSGCTQSAISNYLREDRLPGAEELLKLAKFFGVMMEDLLLDDPGGGYEPEGPPEILQLIKEAHTLELVEHLLELPSNKREEIVKRFKSALDLFEPRRPVKGGQPALIKESKAVRHAALNSVPSALKIALRESKKKPK